MNNERVILRDGDRIEFRANVTCAICGAVNPDAMYLRNGQWTCEACAKPADEQDDNVTAAK